MNYIPQETQTKIVDFLRSNPQLTRFEAAAQLNESDNRILYLMQLHGLKMKRKQHPARTGENHQRILEYVKVNYATKSVMDAANELSVAYPSVLHVCNVHGIKMKPGRNFNRTHQRVKPVKETGFFNVDAMHCWLVDCGPGY